MVNVLLLCIIQAIMSRHIPIKRTNSPMIYIQIIQNVPYIFLCMGHFCKYPKVAAVCFENQIWIDMK